MTARIDPKLTAELRRAARAKRPVEAYVELRAPEKGSAAAAAKALLGRVAKQTHCRVVRSQYLDLLDSLHVAASPEFLRALIAQPEVLAAVVPPSVGDSAMIEPVNPRRVRARDIDVPVRRGESV